MITMGIDQSFTCTGVVIADSDGELEYAEMIKTTLGDGDYFERADMIASEIAEMSRVYGVHEAFIEGLAFSRNQGSSKYLAGLQFVIVSSLRRMPNAPDVTLVAPGSLKKFATGKGNASKDAMVAALPAEVKEYFCDHMGAKKSTGLYDLTDAWFLAKFRDAPDAGES